MKEYDTKEINYQELEFLRKHTRLGPIAILKIQNAEHIAEKFRQWYFSVEGELLSKDTSQAEELEYELHLRAWENKIAPVWQKYGDGLGLTEFAEMAIEQQIEKSKNRSK